MSRIFRHPGQEQMQVEAILASASADRPDDNPIVTMRLRYPRILHGEIMTHRVFSRNARSSRAVPVKTMLNEVRDAPFVPWHWGKNQKGMQASEECNELIVPRHWIGKGGLTREQAWLHARDESVDMVEGMMNAGYHKQIPNRLLEPFSWIDTLITSTDWDNFLWLRDHEDAEPHLQDLARLVGLALGEMDVQELGIDEWHLPYITQQDWDLMDEYHDALGLTSSRTRIKKDLCKISAARCARISYKPFDGDASYERELERYESLVTADRVHASPTEHQATPDRLIEAHEGPYGEWRVEKWSRPHLHGNLTGWIQARKLIPNEAYNGSSLTERKSA